MYWQLQLGKQSDTVKLLMIRANHDWYDWAALMASVGGAGESYNKVSGRLQQPVILMLKD